MSEPAQGHVLWPHRNLSPAQAARMIRAEVVQAESRGAVMVNLNVNDAAEIATLLEQMDEMRKGVGRNGEYTGEW